MTRDSRHRTISGIGIRLQILAISLGMALSLPSLSRAQGTAAILAMVKVDSIERHGGDWKLDVHIQPEHLESLSLEAIDKQLKNRHPRLFKTIHLGTVRYSKARVKATSLDLVPRKDQPGSLAATFTADIVANKERLQIDCDVRGWVPRCTRRWRAHGARTIATVSTNGSVTVAPLRNVSLADKPIVLEVYLSRIDGSVPIGSLGDIDLGFTFSPPERVKSMRLGLPPKVSAQHKLVGELILRDFAISAGKAGSIDVSFTVATP